MWSAHTGREQSLALLDPAIKKVRRKRLAARREGRPYCVPEAESVATEVRIALMHYEDGWHINQDNVEQRSRCIYGLQVAEADHAEKEENQARQRRGGMALLCLRRVVGRAVQRGRVLVHGVRCAAGRYRRAMAHPRGVRDHAQF